MSRKFDAELKARPVRMVHNQVPEYGPITKACAVGATLGIGQETLRN